MSSVPVRHRREASTSQPRFKQQPLWSCSALTHTRHYTRRVPGVPGSTKRRFFKTVGVFLKSSPFASTVRREDPPKHARAQVSNDERTLGERRREARGGHSASQLRRTKKLLRAQARRPCARRRPHVAPLISGDVRRRCRGRPRLCRHGFCCQVWHRFERVPARSIQGADATPPHLMVT